MDKHLYISMLERHFQKGEYITIGHKSFKMLSAPKDFEGKLYCFIVSGEKVKSELLLSLCDYAKSVAFYDDPQKKDKIYALPIFIGENLPSSSLLNKGQKIGGVYLLPAAISLCDGAVLIAKKFPLLNSAHLKKLNSYAKKLLNLSFKTTEE